MERDDLYDTAADALKVAEEALARLIINGAVSSSDHHVIGLPSGVDGAMTGGAYVETAFHAALAARYAVDQAKGVRELPGTRRLDRIQRALAMAGGYAAVVQDIELRPDPDPTR